MQSENHWEKAKESINSVSGLWAKYSNLQLNKSFFYQYTKISVNVKNYFGITGYSILDTRNSILDAGFWGWILDNELCFQHQVSNIKNPLSSIQDQVSNIEH